MPKIPILLFFMRTWCGLPYSHATPLFLVRVRDVRRPMVVHTTVHIQTNELKFPFGMCSRCLIYDIGTSLLLLTLSLTAAQVAPVWSAVPER